MYRMSGQIFASRQLLMHCSNKSHPCNDAKSAHDYVIASEAWQSSVCNCDVNKRLPRFACKNIFISWILYNSKSMFRSSDEHARTVCYQR